MKIEILKIMRDVMEKAMPAPNSHLTPSQESLKAVYYECVREIQELSKNPIVTPEEETCKVETKGLIDVEKQG